MFDVFHLLLSTAVHMSWFSDVYLPDRSVVRVRPSVPETRGMAMSMGEWAILREWHGSFWDGSGSSSLYDLPVVRGAFVSASIADSVALL